VPPADEQAPGEHKRCQHSLNPAPAPPAVQAGQVDITVSVHSAVSATDIADNFTYQ
jgi:hypothetical protein